MNTFLYIGDFRNAHVEVLGIVVAPECLEWSQRDLIVDGCNTFRFWRPSKASLLHALTSEQDPYSHVFHENLDGKAVIIDEIGMPPKVILLESFQANDNDSGFLNTVFQLEFGS